MLYYLIREPETKETECMRMKNRLSIIKSAAAIIALLMAASAFSACSGGDASKEESSEASSQSSQKSGYSDFTLPTVPSDFSLDDLQSMIPDSVPKEIAELFPDFDWSYITELKKLVFGGEVDEETGDVTFDTTVLFDFDSAELTEKGKEDLKKFLDIYVPRVLSDKNKPKLKQIIVEGHTDTTGSHEYNQKLSENRAKAVVKYSIEQYPELKPYIISKGYSYDRPIRNKDGSVNAEESRRVVFKVEAKE